MKTIYYQIFYVISYVLMLISLYMWNGGIFIFISIFSLGIPIILILIPLIGLNMPNIKDKYNVETVYLLTLFPAFNYLIPLKYYPLKTTTTEAGHTILTNPLILPAILISTSVFLYAGYLLYKHSREI